MSSLESSVETTLSPRPRRDLDFDPALAESIAQVAETDGWDVAAHDFMRGRDHDAYRLSIDEYRAQIRFLLPLTSESRVLQLLSSWGPVAFGLAACSGLVVGMDDRTTRLRFASARKVQSESIGPEAVAGLLEDGLPFRDRIFDAVIVLDTFEQIGAADSGGRSQAQQSALAEVSRVLRPGGWLLLGASNRLSPGRASGVLKTRPLTYWGYRRALAQAGFDEIRFHAALPSDREPYLIAPLEPAHVLGYFFEKMIQSPEYRAKADARGLGPIYRAASLGWQIGRRIGVAALVRYVVPSYLILARKA